MDGPFSRSNHVPPDYPRPHHSLELLQAHPRLSGPQIAERLEVDNRTVRRYVTMLQDLGIPVEAERGRYGAYYLRRVSSSRR